MSGWLLFAIVIAVAAAALLGYVLGWQQRGFEELLLRDDDLRERQ